MTTAHGLDRGLMEPFLKRIDDEIRIADRSGGFRVLRFSMENAGPPTGAQVLLEVP